MIIFKFIIFFNNRDIKDEPLSEEKLKTFFKEFQASLVDFKNFLKKIISLEDKLYTARVFIEFYLLKKITSCLNDKFIFLFIANICIFYSVIDKKFPHFLFKCRMSIKQIIEGIIVVIICLIPNYDTREKEKEKETGKENDKKQKIE